MRRPSMQPLAARLRSLLPGSMPGGAQVRGGGLAPVGPGNSRPTMPPSERDALTNNYKAEESGQTPPAISTTGQYTDEQVLAFIDKLRQDAWQARWVHEGRFHTNASYYYDKQWEFWDASKQRMSHWRDLDPNPYRSWLVSNLLKPKIKKLVARSLSANSEVLISPKTDLKDDIEAAKSISAIVEHVAAENHEDEMTLQIERLRHIVGPVFVKTYVDFSSTLLVPILAPEGTPDLDAMGGMGGMQNMAGMPPLPPVGSAAPPPLGAPMPGGGAPQMPEGNPYPQLEEEPDPQILGVKEIQGADIKKCLVPWYEALPDPRSHDPKDWEFFIHEQNMTLSEVRKRFPERGMYVAAGLETSQADRESRTGLINNDNVGMMGKHRMRDERVTVQELWHLPCPAFPKGLVAWRAGSVLLWMGEWLYPSLDTLPFTEYVYEEGLDTPWGFSALESARGPMDVYNKCASILIDAANEGYKVLVPAGTGIPADAFRRGKPNEAITYDPMGAQGAKPELMPLTGTRPEVYQLMEMAKADIAEILEVQPVSDGLVPAGVTAAAAIQALESANRQGSRLAIETMRLAKLRETQIVVKLAKDIYTGEALLSMRDSAAKVSDRGNTERLNIIMDLLASVPGVEQSDYVGALDQYASPADSTSRSKVVRFDVLGRGRVDVDVRVTASKDPAQRLATLQDMASKGFFSPESIETTVVLLEAMQLEDTDKLTEMLLRVLTRMQARQERLMQTQSQQAKAEADAQIQAEQAKAQAATEAEAQKSQIQAQTEALKAQVDSEAKLAQIQAEGQVKADLMRLEAQLKLEHEIQMAQVQADIARQNAEMGLMGDLTRSEHAAMMEAEGDEDEGEYEDEPAPRKPRRRRRKKPALNLEGVSPEVAAEEQEELESGDDAGASELQSNGETHGIEGELLPGGEFLRYDDPDHIAIEEALEEQYPDGLGIGQSSGDDTDD